MKRTDKVLIAIVAGIVLLVVVALVVTLTRPDPTYQAEDSPEGVAHNYLLALQKEEYGRAYRYLASTLKGYPVSTEEFTEHVQHYFFRLRPNMDTILSVESTTITGSSATVKVRESRFRGGDLFHSGQSTHVFEMKLKLEHDAWRIVDSRYYFAWCWKREQGCY